MITNDIKSLFAPRRDLNRKLDEIVGRQERTLSAISSVASGGSGRPAPPVVTGQVPSGTGPMQRHEVDTLLNTQQELQRTVRDVRAVCIFLLIIL